MCSLLIKVVSFSEIDAYIPLAISIPHDKNTGKIMFILVLSRIKRHRKKLYLSQANHNSYICTKKRVESTLQLAKKTFISRKCQNNTNLNYPSLLANRPNPLSQFHFFIYSLFHNFDGRIAAPCIFKAEISEKCYQKSSVWMNFVIFFLLPL